jgi:hypothetical protein
MENNIVFEDIENLKEEIVLKTFNKILLFVNELDNVYGENFNNIKLYNKFLKMTPTTTSEEKNIPVHKQVNVFLQFCKTNTKYILDCNFDKFEEYNIKYNDRVYINLKEIIEKTNEDEKEDTIKTIMSYLSLISFIITGNNNFKNVLNKKNNSEYESTFLDNFKEKIETKFKDSNFTDPLQATMSLFNSGLFNEMLTSMTSDIKEGKLSIPKLLGNVQGMVQELNQENGGSLPLDLNNLIGSVGNMGNMGNMLNGNGGMGLENILGMLNPNPTQNENNSNDILNMLNNMNINDK